jgi:uncharacterized protein (TIGR02246 family)
MRYLLTVLTLACLSAPVSLGAQASDEAAVRAVVQDLFRHMKAGDADAMASLFHDDIRLVSTGVDGSGRPMAQVVPIQAWLDGVRGSTAELDEQVGDLEVRISQGLATVWTPYTLLVDGEFSHCGVDAFQLVRTPDGWRIMEVADTRMQEGCPGR